MLDPTTDESWFLARPDEVFRIRPASPSEISELRQHPKCGEPVILAICSRGRGGRIRKITKLLRYRLPTRPTGTAA